MQIIEDKVYAFSKDNPPCYTAQPGEVLQFNTLDCFSGRLTDETVTMKDMDFSYNITNPAAGPVYVEGAEVGDVLVVDIYDIQVADEGTIATDDHCGPLFEGTDYRTKKIKIEGGMADFNGVRFPINPMIGVIGTAPAEGAPADGFVGNYGGNMDNKLITKGTRLYFPVRVPGALLQMGDVHATMGDAELCGTGIEIAAQITVRVNVLKNFELHWPVLETFGPAGKWYVNCLLYTSSVYKRQSVGGDLGRPLFLSCEQNALARADQGQPLRWGLGGQAEVSPYSGMRDRGGDAAGNASSISSVDPSRRSRPRWQPQRTAGRRWPTRARSTASRTRARTA